MFSQKNSSPTIYLDESVKNGLDLELVSRLVYEKFSFLLSLLFEPNAREVEEVQDYKDESGFQLIKFDSVAGCQDIKIASVVKFENIFCWYFMAWAT